MIRNHVVPLHVYRLIRAMDATGMKDEYPAEEIIRRGNNIYKIGEHCRHKPLTEMTKKDEEIFRRLNVAL